MLLIAEVRKIAAPLPEHGSPLYTLPEVIFHGHELLTRSSVQLAHPTQIFLYGEFCQDADDYSFYRRLQHKLLL